MFEHISGAMQRRDYDCGPAVVKTVMAMHGMVQFDLSDIAAAMNTSEDGTPPANIEKILGLNGLVVIPVHGFEDIVKEIGNGFPVVALVRCESESHYVVVFGVDCQRHVYVFDPLCGVLPYSRESFESLWTDRYAIAVEKSVERSAWKVSE